MDIQTRKIQFIQEFLKHANENLLVKFEKLLKQEREKAFEKDIKPLTLKEYEQHMEKVFQDVNNNRVKSARVLKKEITTRK